jgi:hypothetical protein
MLTRLSLFLAHLRHSRWLIRLPFVDQHPIAVLAGAALLSALIYQVVFVRSFNLIELYDQPLLDLKRVSQSDPWIVWKVAVAFAVLGGLYWLAWRAALKARGRSAWLIVLGGAVVFGILLLFVFPYDAADVFDNILRGRITAVYGFSPFQDVPDRFLADPFYPYMAWRHMTSLYGPGWEATAGLAAKVAGDSVISNVLAAKLMLGAFLVGSIALTIAILRRIAPERALAGALLLAWCPLILHETIGMGHNDIAMIFWVILAVWCLLNRRYTLTILALVVGALFKYLPLMLVPLAGLIALRDLTAARARWRFLAVTVSATVGVILLISAPFLNGANVLNIDLHARLFASSVPAAIYFGLVPALGEDTAGQVVGLAAIMLTAFFVLWQSLRAARDRTDLSFTYAAFYMLMFYLLVTAPWFQHWYVIWPLVIAALFPPSRPVWLAALFGTVAIIKFFVITPLFLWDRLAPGTAAVELWFGPAIMAIPCAYAIFAAWRARSHREDGGSVTGIT